MNEVVIKEGMTGKARLCLAAGKSDQTIDRYRQMKAKPTSDVARKLALACGFSEGDALEIARECTPLAKAG